MTSGIVFPLFTGLSYEVLVMEKILTPTWTRLESKISVIFVSPHLGVVMLPFVYVCHLRVKGSVLTSFWSFSCTFSTLACDDTCPLHRS